MCNVLQSFKKVTEINVKRAVLILIVLRELFKKNLYLKMIICRKRTFFMRNKSNSVLRKSFKIINLK